MAFLSNSWLPFNRLLMEAERGVRGEVSLEEPAPLNKWQREQRGERREARAALNRITEQWTSCALCAEWVVLNAFD